MSSYYGNKNAAFVNSTILSNQYLKNTLNGNVDIPITFTGPTTLADTLNVSGATTLHGATTANSSLNVLGNLIIPVLTFSGLSQMINGQIGIYSNYIYFGYNGIKYSLQGYE